MASVVGIRMFDEGESNGVADFDSDADSDPDSDDAVGSENGPGVMYVRVSASEKGGSRPPAPLPARRLTGRRVKPTAR